MPVPANDAAYLVNTTAGAFSAITQGGTILGNTSTGTVITKALALKDNATDFGSAPLPRVLANGLSANQKAYTAGTFAYSVAGQYVIRTISTTLSGVSSTKMLIPSNEGPHPPIAQFQHDFGAKTMTLMRRNRFARMGWLNNADTKLAKRYLWLNAAGTATATPDTLTTTNMWDLADGNASNLAVDSAATPTRAIPGELVMKVDFVTLTVASGGDFFDYKAITGM